MSEKCCRRHHYTCWVSFDRVAPRPCCVGCEANKVPNQHLPLMGLKDLEKSA